MRILVQNTSLEVGGAPQQMQMAIESLRQKQEHVVFSDNPHHDLTEFDVVWIIHIGTEFCRIAWQNCMKQGRPYIVKAIFAADEKLVPEMALHARYIGVESDVERNAILDACRPTLSATQINFIDNRIVNFQPGVHPDIQNYGTRVGDRPLVHINGRYRPLKNQHAVIQACKELGLPVVCAGWPTGHRIDDGYFRQCCDLKYGELLEVQDKKQLCEIYNRTRVYVCASENEVCSTSVCEAIACGCRVVSRNTHQGNANFQKPGYFVYEEASGLQDAISLAYNSDCNQENEIWYFDRVIEQYHRLLQRAARPTKLL